MESEPANKTAPRIGTPSEGGRDELNIAEFPITFLTNKIPEGLKTLTFSDQVWDQGTGAFVTRKVSITGSDMHGLPGPLDMDVLLCLIQITKLTNDFTDPEVKFNRGDLLRMLHLPDSGNHYRRIDESLRRWLGVTLYHENSWWDKDSQEWSSTEGWHILEHLAITDRAVSEKRRAKGQLELFASTFTWNKIFFRSCQANNIKRLDLDKYFSLERPVSKRMYRFLDKRFYHRRDWTFDLQDFAFEHVGLSRKYDVGEIKAKLRPALAELEAIGFLEPMTHKDRYEKIGPGEWRITVARNSDHRKTEPKPLELLAPQSTPLATALAARGVTPSTATELMAAFPAEHVQARLEAFDWLIEKKDKRVSKSPGGYLADSIRKGYATPKGFESKADRTKRLEAAEEKQRRAAEAKRRAEAAERAREEAEQARIDTYWNSLTPADQEALRTEALAKPNPFVIGLYRKSRKGSPEAERYLKIILQSHITALLDQKDEAQATA